MNLYAQNSGLIHLNENDYLLDNPSSLKSQYDFTKENSELNNPKNTSIILRRKVSPPENYVKNLEKKYIKYKFTKLQLIRRKKPGYILSFPFRVLYSLYPNRNLNKTEDLTIIRYVQTKYCRFYKKIDWIKFGKFKKQNELGCIKVFKKTFKQKQKYNKNWFKQWQNLRTRKENIAADLKTIPIYWVSNHFDTLTSQTILINKNKNNFICWDTNKAKRDSFIEFSSKILLADRPEELSSTYEHYPFLDPYQMELTYGTLLQTKDLINSLKWKIAESNAKKIFTRLMRNGRIPSFELESFEIFEDWPEGSGLHKFLLKQPKLKNSIPFLRNKSQFDLTDYFGLTSYTADLDEDEEEESYTSAYESLNSDDSLMEFWFQAEDSDEATQDEADPLTFVPVSQKIVDHYLDLEEDIEDSQNSLRDKLTSNYKLFKTHRRVPLGIFVRANIKQKTWMKNEFFQAPINILFFFVTEKEAAIFVDHLSKFDPVNSDIYGVKISKTDGGTFYKKITKLSKRIAPILIPELSELKRILTTEKLSKTQFLTGTPIYCFEDTIAKDLKKKINIKFESFYLKSENGEKLYPIFFSEKEAKRGWRDLRKFNKHKVRLPKTAPLKRTNFETHLDQRLLSDKRYLYFPPNAYPNIVVFGKTLKLKPLDNLAINYTNRLNRIKLHVNTFCKKQKAYPLDEVPNNIFTSSPELRNDYMENIYKKRMPFKQKIKMQLDIFSKFIKNEKEIAKYKLVFEYKKISELLKRGYYKKNKYDPPIRKNYNFYLKEVYKIEKSDIKKMQYIETDPDE